MIAGRLQAMTKLMRGIVHGQTIEVNEDLGLSDGQAVDLIVMPAGLSETPPTITRSPQLPKKLPGPPPGWRPDAAVTTAGLLAGEWTDEDDIILDQIHAERKAATWRESPK
jgi:hypothetical protein